MIDAHIIDLIGEKVMLETAASVRDKEVFDAIQVDLGGQCECCCVY